MTGFRVWAPAASAVTLAVLDDERQMTPDPAAPGWWRAEAPGEPGTRYGFRLDDGPTVLPDPRSLRQPDGVHGRSAVYDHAAFDWSDEGWRGVDLRGAVLYELHVGTFTPEGTFDAATQRLDHLVELGVDAVELMPCAAFPGRYGWGYDGVDLFAVHEPYGGPDGLKRFVDAAHSRGVGVVIDVVYNHLGPDGNYLPQFGPYLTDTHHTPWGSAVNLDAPGSDEVRAFLLDNARMWLRDYHCDGLRLDAVHALADTRATHLLEELAGAVGELSAQLSRGLFLIAESDLNDPRLVRPVEAGGYGLDASWCDDVHHALHATLTGERQGYYVDFGPLPVLAKALTSGYVHDGSYSTFRGRHHGRPAGDLPGWRFVTFLQDHDQIGNRAAGERLSQLVSPQLLRIAAVLLLTSPFVPMLFMGEEWGATTPWCYFTDHQSPQLARAVTEGRRAEFAAHGWAAADVPDPQDPATVAASVLDWSEPQASPGRELVELHRRLIGLRRSVPALGDGRRDLVRVEVDEAAATLVMYRGRGEVAVVVNLSEQRAVVEIDATPVEALVSTLPGFTYSAGRVELDGPSAVVVRLLG